MADFAFEWITTEGGPLLLLLEKHLDAWDGTDEPSNGRIVEANFRWNPDISATDYDRACDVDDFLGVIDVGEGQGIVFGDKPLMTTWLPLTTELGKMFVRWVEAENEADLIEFATSFSQTDFHDTLVSITVEDSDLILFAAYEAGRDNFDVRLRIGLANGRYKFSTLYVSDRLTTVLCHRLSKTL
ncbi:MAG TPA: Imm21 family immunity protein [Pyrinomonadaceae bacterium]|jgi:hypothetical protein